MTTGRRPSRPSSGPRPRAFGGGLEGSLDLIHPERLDPVAHLEVVEVLDTDAALEALAHLAHVILEALEARQRAGVDGRAVAGDPRLAGALDGAASDDAAGDGADFADLEELQHLGLAQDDFLLLGLEQAFERVPDVLHRFVDDAVGTDVHLLPLGRGARVGVGPHVEAQHDGARRFGQQHVALADGADATVDYVHPDFTGAELGERVGQGLRRAALVGLDDDAERGDAALLERAAEVLEAGALLAPAVLRLALEPLALLGDLTRLVGVGDHREGVACRGHALEAQDLDRNRRARLLHRLAPLVVQGAHAAG